MLTSTECPKQNPRFSIYLSAEKVFIKFNEEEEQRVYRTTGVIVTGVMGIAKCFKHSNHDGDGEHEKCNVSFSLDHRFSFCLKCHSK